MSLVSQGSVGDWSYEIGSALEGCDGLSDELVLSYKQRSIDLFRIVPWGQLDKKDLSFEQAVCDLVALLEHLQTDPLFTRMQRQINKTEGDSHG